MGNNYSEAAIAYLLYKKYIPSLDAIKVVGIGSPAFSSIGQYVNASQDSVVYGQFLSEGYSLKSTISYCVNTCEKSATMQDIVNNGGESGHLLLVDYLNEKFKDFLSKTSVIKLISEYINNTLLVSPTNITPTSATVGKNQEFTLTGDGLLEKPYNVTIEGCPNIQYTSATSTKHVFSCTPTDALSALVVITNPDTGALVSKQLSIDFTVAPVVLPTAVKITLDAQGIDAVSGVVNGNVSFITGRNGGKAAKFNGVSDPASIRIPNTDNIKFDTGATFDMWVRLDSMTGMNGNAQIVSNGQYVMALLAKSHDNNGSAFTTTASGKSYFNTYNSTWGAGSSIPCFTNESLPVIPIGEWYRITYTISPTTGIQTYVNKQLYMSCSDIRPDFEQMNTQDLYIGQYSSFWYPLNGAIQDIRIYKSALTPNQVAVMP